VSGAAVRAVSPVAPVGDVASHVFGDGGVGDAIDRQRPQQDH
jgi:hypothetical protein